MLLDYDGTLAPFQPQRHRAVPYPGVRETLSELLNAPHCTLVLISGRAIKDLIPLLGLKSLPEIWGSHGMERLRVDGTYELAPLEEGFSHALRTIKQWCHEAGLSRQCELKPGALAIHWRGQAEARASATRDLIARQWADRAREIGLRLQPFDGGIEFRTPGNDKGQAVKRILSELDDDSPVAYLGDDLTDEDAFQAVRNRGIGILVNARLRTTGADLWLVPPEELLQFLSSWKKICGGKK